MGKTVNCQKKPSKKASVEEKVYSSVPKMKRKKK